VSQSICNYCARAWARPDPAGCGWHREEHEIVFQEARIHKIDYRVYNKIPGFDGMVTVTKCKLFEMTPPRGIIQRPNAVKKTFDREQMEEMARLLYEDSATYAEVAFRYGIDKNSLVRLLEKEKLFRRKGQGKRVYG